MKNETQELVFMHEDEGELLKQFWAFVDSHTLPITWTGYNVDFFDCPFIRMRTLAHGIYSPSLLSFGKFTIDLIKVLFPSNGSSYRKFIDVAWACGIQHNSTINGCDMPRLWTERNFDAIREHCADDIRGEWQLYERMCKVGMI